MAKRKLYNPELGELNDFKNFLYMVWMFLPDIGRPPTRIQYDIADYLQMGEDDWAIIMAYRGIGKSYITAAFVVWLWLIDHNFKILVLSASEDKAKDFSHLVRSIINGLEICEHLRPRAGQRDSTLSFDVGPAGISKDPSLNVYGINGQITGGRADFIIPDDIEISTNSDTVTKREALQKKLDELAAIVKPDIYGFAPQIKMLGTPQTQQSIYFELEKRGYTIRVWPARYPTKKDNYADRLAPLLKQDMLADRSLAGKPINPEMHSHEELEKRAHGRRAWFQLQYMLDPTLADEDRYPLKLRDMMVFNVDPEQGPIHMAYAADPRVLVNDSTLPVMGMNGDRFYSPFKVSDSWLPWQEKILVIDPAGGRDETAYSVLYFLKGFIYLTEMGGFLGGLERSMAALADVAAAHRVHTVLVERNFGAAVGDDGEKTSHFVELFRPILLRKHKCALEVTHSSGQKEKRICDTLEPVLASHRLIVSPEVIRKDASAKDHEGNPAPHLSGLYQLSHLTRDRGCLLKDDRVDSLALGVAHLLTRLAEDVEATEEKHREEQQEIFFRKFMERATKGQYQEDQSNTWLNLDEDNLVGDPEVYNEEEEPWWAQG